MAAGRKDFRYCSVLHFGGISLQLKMLGQNSSTAWNGCMSLFMMVLILLSILTSAACSAQASMGPVMVLAFLITLFSLFLSDVRAPNTPHQRMDDICEFYLCLHLYASCISVLKLIEVKLILTIVILSSLILNNSLYFMIYFEWHVMK